ncbi:50S ribosomal protein L11 methyltransferase [Litoribacter ruber]|uniref:Ribosomal protein L11 methyltransferase n=1 Tax=Litoribacter ruber TaxID=702568 RepID=A0AAP2CJL4_9BACT|nr:MULTISPECIES: 50S ribosomal protein L11 methyltransferase [Litoribacter]MBS9525377.1 50S ribosomal protein L11 methyltransferase [Litoribacter alkaliphilus]MBT0809763.1 50S ribosomal protein L11 methyltransferase [Litoribacter ruber]
MEYLEFKISCKPEFAEILIAELAEVGFDSFLENEAGFEAYAEENNFDRSSFEEVIERYTQVAEIAVVEGKMEKVNWNTEWEKNYDPIEVGDEVFVRASFHAPKPGVTHDILINPKMSFGTGHHATTFLMLTHQLNLDHKGKSVIDIGSGTGILAIMANKLGAKEVQAFDIDDWCVENGNENFDLNGMSNVRMGLGTVREVNPQGQFDIVLANINKNVLLDEMEVYETLVKPAGHLLLSGFYDHDVEDIEAKANSLGFQKLDQKVKDKWTALVFEKKG